MKEEIAQMENKPIHRLQYFVIISDKKKKNKFISLLNEQGGHEINVIYGKGSVNAGFWAQAFGIEVEEEKVFLSCILPEEKAAPLMQLLYEDYDFKKRNTGIAFSVSIEGLIF